MNNFCTLFDSNYLTRGIAMYESLKKHCNKFHLYIFAFDDTSIELLQKLNLDCITLVPFFEFEDELLLEIKKDRTAGEYCWTCTPSVIKYSIENYNLESCTYVDADLYFFSNPSVLIEEMAEKSVLITEHRYTPEYDKSNTSGKYCVQFMTFKNNIDGMKVLNWWRDSCNAWCYARHENGKFGDQMYLDDWTTRFAGVHVLKHLGGGVAPWNIQQYNLKDVNFDLVFYHFHEFKFLDNNMVDLGGYKLTIEDLKILYKPYVIHLEKIMNDIIALDKNHNYHGITKKRNDWKSFLRNFKRILKRNYNVYDIDHIMGL